MPPGFRPIGLRELGDAFRHAVTVAPTEGAGTLVWTRRFDLVEVAVVLEPEEPLASARRALFAGMSSAADALAAHCPPEKPITFAWPDTILFDRGLIGGMRLGWPDGTTEGDVPEWMVVGLMLRLMMSTAPAHRERTSLEAEGFDILEPSLLIGSFARHLMVHFDTWRVKGFQPVGQDYLARLSPEKGTRRGIDANGDLLIHRTGVSGPAERRSLVEGLTSVQWLDPETQEPLI